MEAKHDSAESIPSGAAGFGPAQLLDDLVRVEVRLHTLLDARLRDRHGHGLGRIDLLRTVAEVPGCRVSDVVRRLGITVGAASKGIERQVRDGLVRRDANPEDGRSSLLVLTPAGRQILDETLPALDREVAAVLRGTGVPAGDLAHLAHVLAAVRAALEAGRTG
ncbi:MarR family winged helix-turn-helix transcriptional regulator [Promicromonospora iranensis]|jgi:DNA-binding MarR family transcriptional regulator|uniref:MarR family winged helix-turn-helix transcriptional regulator n=1 Tax=Promicromonospora iranensis TaxID=1105144 RepID=UPI0023A9CB56|nr:MarR family winged helix-turn-helix transcriptional regulator [Promicromonospora iranensis]